MEKNRQLNQEEYMEIIEKFKKDNKVDYENGKIKKVFLECLPTGGSGGIGYNQINWLKSISSYMVYFIYKNIEGEIEIINYNKENRKLKIKYNKKEYEISTDGFKGCKLGEILGKITKDFKIEIGTRFQDDKRDIIITDREYRLKERIDKKGRKSIVNRKYYKYTCNKCGWTEGWITEGDVDNKGHGCSCCSNQTPVLGINTIYDTDKWMISIVGEEVAKTHTCGSSDYCQPICTNCGRVKNKKMRINSIYFSHGMNCSCSDKISYPEKVIFNVLEQLGVNFEYHKTFKWSKNIQVNNPKLCGSKEYDFCCKLNNENILLETHGNQHYEESFGSWDRTLCFEQTNDKLKKELALYNGITEDNYITIDCRKSELKWIKDNILKSNLTKLFGLAKINWNKAEEFALSNRVKEACELWSSGVHSTSEIGKIMKLHRKTINEYLKKGSSFELNWCDYNPKEVMERNSAIEIICIETGCIFKSISNCEKNSINLFGEKLNGDYISDVCKGKRNEYKGFTFRFIKDITEEQIKEIQENAKFNQAI